MGAEFMFVFFLENTLDDLPFAVFGYEIVVDELERYVITISFF